MLSHMNSADLDRAHVWHPFTQMREWNDPAHAPVVIVEGRGAILKAEDGCEFLDGNSSIWTNLHGHRRAEIDGAIRAQLGRIAHSSFLGLTNDMAARLARELVEVTRLPEHKVFYSDDGSTAMEAALKMVYQARVQRGEEKRTTFISFASGYHGDTIGAMSAGHSAVFHAAYKPLLFETREVMSPACYRCPFNRAEPVRGTDARLSRKCNWECAGHLTSALDGLGDSAAAVVIEPRVQGAAGMRMHPHGYLERAATACRERGVWLVLDEVMTGFGRTGKMFACEHENVTPDLIALAKGLTGGPSPCRDAGVARNLRRVSRRLRGVEDPFSWPQLHGQRAGLRGSVGEPENFRDGKDAGTQRRPRAKPAETFRKILGASARRRCAAGGPYLRDRTRARFRHAAAV